MAAAVAMLTGLAVPLVWGWLVVGASGLFCLWWVIRRPWLATLGLCLLAAALGSQRAQMYQAALREYDRVQNQKISLRVIATEDAVYGNQSQLTFVAADIRTTNGIVLPGKISVSGFGLNAVMQSDELIVQGTLRPGIGGYQGFMSYAQLQLLAHHPSKIADLRRRFAAGMLTALPEPLGSFSMGLLIGQRASLPDGVKQSLLMVGLTHIIAVSGYNLTIILQSCRRLLARVSKRLALHSALVMMLVFIALTGASPSIIRAAMVSGLSLLAGYYGRPLRPVMMIALVAAITAYWQPLYIWGDPSWYLSFLAFVGILVIAPLLQRRLPKPLNRSTLAAIAIETMSAEIMSMPYVVHNFGQMSLVGLPANMLVVTFVPLAMLLGLIAGVSGMVMVVMCGWFAWPARLLLHYMLAVAASMSAVPHVFVEGIVLSTGQMVACYAGIGGMVALLGFKDRQKTAIITDNTTPSSV